MEAITILDDELIPQDVVRLWFEVQLEQIGRFFLLKKFFTHSDYFSSCVIYLTARLHPEKSSFIFQGGMIRFNLILVLLTVSPGYLCHFGIPSS